LHYFDNTPDQYLHPTFKVYMQEQSGTLYTIETDFNKENERSINEHQYNLATLRPLIAFRLKQSVAGEIQELELSTEIS
jgi:hypothetical protein